MANKLPHGKPRGINLQVIKPPQEICQDTLPKPIARALEQAHNFLQVPEQFIPQDFFRLSEAKAPEPQVSLSRFFRPDTFDRAAKKNSKKARENPQSASNAEPSAAPSSEAWKKIGVVAGVVTVGLGVAALFPVVKIWVMRQAVRNGTRLFAQGTAAGVALVPVGAAALVGQTASASLVLWQGSALVRAATLGLPLVLGTIGKDVIETVGRLVKVAGDSIVHTSPPNATTPDGDTSPHTEEDEEKRKLIERFFFNQFNTSLSADFTIKGVDFSFMMGDSLGVLPGSLEKMEGIFTRIRKSPWISYSSETLQLSQSIAVNRAKQCRESLSPGLMSACQNNADFIKSMEAEEAVYEKGKLFYETFRYKDWFDFKRAPERKEVVWLKLARGNETFHGFKEQLQHLNYIMKTMIKSGLSPSAACRAFEHSLRESKVNPGVSLEAFIRTLKKKLFDELLKSLNIKNSAVETQDLDRARVAWIDTKDLATLQEAWPSIVEDFKRHAIDYILASERFSNCTMHIFPDLDLTSASFPDEDNGEVHRSESRLGEYFLRLVRNSSSDPDDFVKDVLALKAACKAYASEWIPPIVILHNALTKNANMTTLSDITNRIHAAHNNNIWFFRLPE